MLFQKEPRKKKAKDEQGIERVIRVFNLHEKLMLLD